MGKELFLLSSRLILIPQTVSNQELMELYRNCVKGTRFCPLKGTVFRRQNCKQDMKDQVKVKSIRKLTSLKSML